MFDLIGYERKLAEPRRMNVTSEQEMYVMYVKSFSIFTLLQLCWMAVIDAD